MNSINTPESTETLQTLEKLASGNDIAAAVAIEALSCEEPIAFFEDLSRNGCVSGMVWSLIYYTDTHAFFDQHYDEIEALRDEMEDNLGEPLKIEGDLKNCLAWFAFEEVAFKLASEWEVI